MTQNDTIKNTPPLLEPGAVEQFQRDGFIAVPGLIAEHELAAAKNAIDAAVAQRCAEDMRALEEKNRYEQTFIQCMRLWEDYTSVRPFTFHPKIAQAAAELLEAQAVRLWQDQALYKEPGGQPTTAHQDQSFWPIGDAPLISAWVALSDSTQANGAMSYVPGSHKAGRLKAVDITHQSKPYDVLEDAALLGRKPQLVEAVAGTVIFHHGYSVHMAGANQTEEVRRAMTMVYIADGAIRQQDWPVFGLDRDEVAVGAVIEGPGIPIAWPRERDALPPAPKQLGAKTGFGFKR